MQGVKDRIYEFGPFSLDMVRRTLSRDGVPLQLSQKAFDTLVVLIENRGRVVEKGELLNRIWPDSFVEEINLNVQVSTLRKTLGESPTEHRYIVTVPKRGYSFVAPIQETLEPVLTTRQRLTNGQPADPPLLPSKSGVSKTSFTLTAISVDDPSVSSSPVPRRKRFQRSHLFLLGLILFALGVATTLLVIKRFRLSPERPIKTMAVLPFKSVNAEGDKSLELGMADALITKLNQLPTIVVRPTSAIFRYAEQDVETLAAGRALEVDAVLEGTIQQSANRVRITTRLIELTEGKTIWADSFEERLGNLFGVQDSISERVAQALVVKLTDEQKQQLAKRQTEDWRAFQLYSLGYNYRRKGYPEDLQKSIEYYKQAIALDPGFARAHAALAEVKVSLWGAQIPDKEPYFLETETAASTALALDETLAEAQVAFGFFKAKMCGDKQSAKDHYQRALELDPNNASAYHKYAQLILIEQPDRAVEMMQQAAKLDPLSPAINGLLGRYLFFVGQYGRAIEQCNKIAEMLPDAAWNYVTKGIAHEQMGQYKEAIEWLQKAKALSKEESGEIAASLAHAYAQAGRQAEALHILNNLKKDEKMLPDCALVYLGLGEQDQALAAINKALAQQISVSYALRLDPRFEPLRQDTRFKALMAARN